MDPRKILEALTQNPAGSGALGGLAGSLLGSVLTGGKVRAGGLVKAGGLATVGYLAYQAWQRHQAQKTGQPAPALNNVLNPATPAALPAAFDLTSAPKSSQALRVIQAMVAAAKADGVVDNAEHERIFDRLKNAQLATEDQDYVHKLLTQPLDIETVVRGVDSPELASEIYAASMMAVHPASRAEQAYLQMLAARLNLEPGLVAELDRSVTAAVPA
jgi:uncharacterized membrane protein YebE (DUF533 family)